MKQHYKHLLLAVYHLTYSFIYVGWLTHRSLEPTILCYSKSYFIFLLAMSLGFLIPVFLLTSLKRFGWGKISHVLASGAVFLFLLYFVFSLHYYYNQKHLFDPFLQNHITPIEGLKEVKNKDTFRIICLGDSATKNLGIPEEKQYIKILHSILRRRYPSVNIEVIDGSATWYTTKHSLISYVTYYQDWDADLIILMHGINDLARSFSPPGVAFGEYNELWTHFYGPSMKGAKPPTFEEYLLEYFDTPANAWYAGWRFRKINYPPERYVSLPMFKKNLRKLVDYIQNNGSRVILVTQPSLYKDVMPEEELRTLYFGRTIASTRINFLQTEFPSPQSFRKGMQLFNDTAKKVAHEEGIPVVDAANRVEKTLRNFHDDIHYTESGANALAEVIARAITNLSPKGK